MTTQILSEKIWTPEIVKKRQEELIQCFRDGWKLSYSKISNQILIEHNNIKFYITQKRGANAEGYPTESGFVVKAHSKLSNDVTEKFKENSPNECRLREQLCNDRIVIDGVFQEDYEFTSISFAATVILGRTANGRVEWVNSNGFKYAEILDIAENKGTFNINDESTYGYIKTGSLAYELFKKIFELENISDEEVEKLKTKDYTKQLFSKTNYPALAENSDDNRGRSDVVRYRKTPIIYKGKEIYLTTQWFAENRNDIIGWYKKHL